MFTDILHTYYHILFLSCYFKNRGMLQPLTLTDIQKSIVVSKQNVHPPPLHRCIGEFQLWCTMYKYWWFSVVAHHV